MRYLIAGNLWLFVALIMFLGRTYERSQPVRVSLFGVGNGLSMGAYNGIVLLCLILGIVLLALGLWRGKAARD